MESSDDKSSTRKSSGLTTAVKTSLTDHFEPHLAMANVARVEHNIITVSETIEWKWTSFQGVWTNSPNEERIVRGSNCLSLLTYRWNSRDTQTNSQSPTQGRSKESVSFLTSQSLGRCYCAYSSPNMSYFAAKLIDWFVVLKTRLQEEAQGQKGAEIAMEVKQRVDHVSWPFYWGEKGRGWPRDTRAGEGKRGR